MTDWADYHHDFNKPPNSEEQALQFALVDFRTMKPDTQKAFLTAALDEYVSLARDGKVDVFTADQILFRAQWVASYVNLPQPGQLKMVANVR